MDIAGIDLSERGVFYRLVAAIVDVPVIVFFFRRTIGAGATNGTENDEDTAAHQLEIRLVSKRVKVGIVN